MRYYRLITDIYIQCPHELEIKDSGINPEYQGSSPIKVENLLSVTKELKKLCFVHKILMNYEIETKLAYLRFVGKEYRIYISIN